MSIIQESEVDPYMMLKITTDKFNAVCAAEGLPPDSSADVVFDVMLDKLSLLEIYHRAQGWLEKRLFDYDAKKKRGDVVK